VEAFNHVVVVNIVGLVENHTEVVLNDVTIKLVDVVDGRVSRDLVAYVGWVLSECLAEDHPGTLAEAADVGVRNWGALFKPIESVSREHRFTDTTGPADQGIVWGRSGQRWLKRTRELTHL